MPIFDQHMFRQAFGLEVEVDKELPFTYLTGDELYQTIKTVVDAIEATYEPPSGYRLPVWENGWRENLDNYVSSGFDFRELFPRYLAKRKTYRLCGRYIKSEVPYFEYEVARIFRRALFKKYFADVDVIYEFGAGTGLILRELAYLFPDKRIVGFDWATPSERIVSLVSGAENLNIECRMFNMFSPHGEIQSGAGILTCHSMEQLGDAFEPFGNWLIRQRPKTVIHLEPISLWYRTADVLDNLAYAYHRKRGYLAREFVSWLRDRVEIREFRRGEFGGMMHDPYSRIIWGM